MPLCINPASIYVLYDIINFCLGTFCPGTFCPGTFCPGTFCPGTFCPGTFYPGTFCRGTFCPGTFCPGTFCPGHFVRAILSGDILSGHTAIEIRNYAVLPMEPSNRNKAKTCLKPTMFRQYSPLGLFPLELLNRHFAAILLEVVNPEVGFPSLSVGNPKTAL